ncbi:MAG: acyltransferase [Sphingobium sp.]
MLTFGQVLDRNKGIGPGFDFLRIGLALTIVATHTLMLTGNADLLNQTPFWFLKLGLVPMFFALVGFLVTASGLRLSLKNFLINRGIRIIPALGVDVLVCALILGPLVTTVALSDYFCSPSFYSYFLNILGFIHYKLPGVFDYYPDSKVNGALWTVPYEILCYIFISLLIFLRWLSSAAKVIAVTLAYWGFGALMAATGAPDHLPHMVGKIIEVVFISNGARIVTAFLIGIVLYQLRAHIPYSKRLFVLSISICLFTAGTHQTQSPYHIFYSALLLPALAYLTIFIGLTRVPIPQYFHKGDYSYGIYLYHYPFIHLIIINFWDISRTPVWGALFTYALIVPMILGVSYISWRFIEKPTLAMRKKFSYVARVRDLGDSTETKPPAAAPIPLQPATGNTA